MNRRYRVNLSVESIDTLINELDKYQDDLNRKCQMFCERLAEKGIYAAKAYLVGSKYGSYITFTIETDPVTTGGKALMVATQTGYITSMWQTKEGIQTADVSPLLMAEFGSGQYADAKHRGTFPSPTAREHAENPPWHWKGMDDKWHSSYGIKPLRPMFEASQEMIREINATVKEVFGNG